MFVGSAEANSTLPLIYESDLEYLGGYRLPTGSYGDSPQGNAFSTDSGRALAYYPTNHSMFLVGHKYDQMIAELSIPALVNSTNKADMNTATVIQAPTDPSDGRRCYIGPNATYKCGGTGCLLGGFLVNVSTARVVGTSFAVYNGLCDVVLSHYTFNKEWSSGVEAEGMFKVGDMAEIDLNVSGFVDGYMCWIPEEWRDEFEGDALTGNACLAIISRTSLGPSAWVFNSSDVGTGTVGNETDPSNETNATPLVYYSEDYPTLGEYDSLIWNENYNMATEICGIVFPNGTRSVLFFGRHGMGTPCYGPGTANISETPNCDPNGTCNNQTIGDGNCCCYDPASSAKGVHGYPYAYYVWAYDANDLLGVKTGTTNPWNVTPYATWDWNSTFDIFAPPDGSKRIFGAAYDESNQTIYVTQVNADRYTYEDFPIIQAFKLNISGSSFNPKNSKAYYNISSPISNVVNTSSYHLWNRELTSEDTECAFSLKVTT